MALSQGLTLEIRPETGSNDNAGGYNPFLNPVSGIDYTPYDDAPYKFTDLACASTATPYVTTAAGEFTQAMVGNILKLNSGTNIASGRYEIVEWISSTKVKVDRTICAAAGAASDGVGRIGGALKYFDNSFTDSSLPDMANIWVSQGVMNVPAHFTWTSSPATVQIRGYAHNRDGIGDEPTGNDRPVINFTKGGMSTSSDGPTWHNLRFLHADHVKRARFGESIAINCEFMSSSASGNAQPYDCTNARFINCEFDNVLSSGLAAADSIGSVIRMDDASYSASFIGCWFHNAQRAVWSDAMRPRFTYCVFSDCATGVHSLEIAGNVPRFIANTFYKNSVGIYLENGMASLVAVNNLFTECLSGIYSRVQSSAVFIDYNNFYNNTVNHNCPVLDHNFSQDPMLTDPANGDFTIGINSPSIGLGFTPSLGVGT